MKQQHTCWYESFSKSVFFLFCFFCAGGSISIFKIIFKKYFSQIYAISSFRFFLARYFAFVLHFINYFSVYFMLRILKCFEWKKRHTNNYFWINIVLLNEVYMKKRRRRRRSKNVCVNICRSKFWIAKT